MTLNLTLPGNPRYQPKDLQPIMGYDRIVQHYITVELATMDVLGRDLKIIPPEIYALLTDGVRTELYKITTTEVDARERSDEPGGRKATKHDVRALVQLMQDRMPEALRPWVHIPLTSYDVIDTARALMMKQAHKEVIVPKVLEVLRLFSGLIQDHSHHLQIGRSHGKHAVPITFGLWLASCAGRILHNAIELEASRRDLVGKIAGPVGAKNAEIWLEIAHNVPCGQLADLVGEQLDLQMAEAPTQIVPPEPMARFLFNCVLLSSSLAQFANDCRHLMREEIAEVGEEFEEGQTGSSTMAHKRNPVTFEGIVGAHIKNEAEILKVVLTLTSEHQRDLTGSAVMRDFTTIIVNLVSQLDALLRRGGKDGRAFLDRMRFDTALAMDRALTSRRFSLAEPLYILLQTIGKYPGDAHHLVNHRVVPLLAGSEWMTMRTAIETIGKDDEDVADAWARVPETFREACRSLRAVDIDPDELPLAAYAGESSGIALNVVDDIELFLTTTGEGK